jgi:hypothetical protein
MAKAAKRIARARKVRKTITTMAQAVAVYGGTAKMAKAFRSDPERIDAWLRAGYVLGPQHHLGIMVGLEQPGYEAAPKLFGLRSWSECPGI